MNPSIHSVFHAIFSLSNCRSLDKGDIALPGLLVSYSAHFEKGMFEREGVPHYFKWALVGFVNALDDVSSLNNKHSLLFNIFAQLHLWTGVGYLLFADV